MNKRKRDCGFEKYFVEALTDELPDDVRGELEPHLRGCASCRRKYRETERIHSLLLRHVRPTVPKIVLNKYKVSLKSAFAAESLWKRLGVPLRRWGARFFTPRGAWGFSGAVGILLLGILIGRFVFGTKFSVGESPVSQTASKFTESDIRFISNFLTQSEIWLMEMSHADQSNEIDRENMELNRELARRLLAKSAFMENKLAGVKETSILQFLNRLEMILLETSGAKDQELDEAFRQIRQAIHETALLDEIQNIRQLIKMPIREGV
jgi:hypothetical protein